MYIDTIGMNVKIKQNKYQTKNFMLDPILAPLYLLFTWSKLSCSPLAPGLWLLFQEISNCLNHCLML